MISQVNLQKRPTPNYNRATTKIKVLSFILRRVLREKKQSAFRRIKVFARKRVGGSSRRGNIQEDGKTQVIVSVIPNVE